MTKSMVEERVERAILYIREQKVMLDQDLAALYGVETGQLVRAVKRQALRFPSDFMFQLSDQEVADLKCQSGISRSWGGRRTKPHAFTEQGVAMLSSVLRSKRAIEVNIEIMRAFVRLRKLMASQEDMWRKIMALEKKYDRKLRVVFEAINALMQPDEKEKKRIGFIVDGRSGSRSWSQTATTSRRSRDPTAP